MLAARSYSRKLYCRAHSPHLRDWTLPTLMFKMILAKALSEAGLLPTTSGGLCEDHHGQDAQQVCLLLRQIFLGSDRRSLFLILCISHKIPNPSQSWGPQTASSHLTRVLTSPDIIPSLSKSRVPRSVQTESWRRQGGGTQHPKSLLVVGSGPDLAA